MTLLPVLLAGGTGSRLWPLSREHFPKQFLALTDPYSLLQNTALRTLHLPGVAAPLAICGEAHRFLVAEQLRDIGVPQARVLLEPEGRNTAPAATCAALWARDQYGPETILFVMAADHRIADEAAFVRAATLAADAARAGHIVSFGIRPTRPETGFGYIRAGAPLPIAGVRQIVAFVEKPPLAKAEAFVSEGGYYWNGGMFLFRADLFLEEIARLDPPMLQSCEASLRNARQDLDFIRLDGPSFARARNVSIDCAVMEKTDKAAMVPLDAGWDDIGSWNFLATLPEVDDRGNLAHGDALVEDCDGTLVESHSRLVAALGLKDLVIIETTDAVLVAARDRLQDVKKVVTRLKAAQRSEAVSRPRVYRPWGWYETITLAERFQVKHILVKPREKLSLQMHHHRAEHWVVVTGTALVINGEHEFLLHEDQSTYIPLGHPHRLENPGIVPLELIEVQSGSYLGEDDIVRFEDLYGRMPDAKVSHVLSSLPV